MRFATSSYSRIDGRHSLEAVVRLRVQNMPLLPISRAKVNGARRKDRETKRIPQRVRRPLLVTIVARMAIRRSFTERATWLTRKPTMGGP